MKVCVSKSIQINNIYKTELENWIHETIKDSIMQNQGKEKFNLRLNKLYLLKNYTVWIFTQKKQSSVIKDFCNGKKFCFKVHELSFIINI